MLRKTSDFSPPTAPRSPRPLAEPAQDAGALDSEERASLIIVLVMDSAFGAAALGHFRRAAPFATRIGLATHCVPPVWTGIHRFVGETLTFPEMEESGRALVEVEPFILVLGDEGAAGDARNPCLLSGFAWNEADIGALDALGQIPPGRRLEPSGPAFRESVAPVKPALEALHTAGIAGLQAHDCGHGLSNALVYAILRRGFHRVLWLSAPDAGLAARSLTTLASAMVDLAMGKRARGGAGDP